MKELYVWPRHGHDLHGYTASARSLGRVRARPLDRHHRPHRSSARSCGQHGQVWLGAAGASEFRPGPRSQTEAAGRLIASVHGESVAAASMRCDFHIIADDADAIASRSSAPPAPAHQCRQSSLRREGSCRVRTVKARIHRHQISTHCRHRLFAGRSPADAHRTIARLIHQPHMPSAPRAARHGPPPAIHLRQRRPAVSRALTFDIPTAAHLRPTDRRQIGEAAPGRFPLRLIVVIIRRDCSRENRVLNFRMTAESFRQGFTVTDQHHHERRPLAVSQCLFQRFNAPPQR